MCHTILYYLLFTGPQVGYGRVPPFQYSLYWNFHRKVQVRIFSDAPGYGPLDYLLLRLFISMSISLHARERPLFASIYLSLAIIIPAMHY